MRPTPSARAFPPQDLQLQDADLAVKQPVMRKQLLPRRSPESSLYQSLVFKTQTVKLGHRIFQLVSNSNAPLPTEQKWLWEVSTRSRTNPTKKFRSDRCHGPASLQTTNEGEGGNHKFKRYLLLDLYQMSSSRTSADCHHHI